VALAQAQAQLVAARYEASAKSMAYQIVRAAERLVWGGERTIPADFSMTPLRRFRPFVE
jgi:hypothetical protein